MYALAERLELQMRRGWHAPGLHVDQLIGRGVELPDFAEVEFQGFAEDAKNSVAGFGNILRFGQDARNRQLQIRLFTHAVAFEWRKTGHVRRRLAFMRLLTT